jgi:hypothetical protein
VFVVNSNTFGGWGLVLTAAAVLCYCCLQTPTMTMPLQAGCDAAAAQLLTNRMRRLRLAECLKGIKVGAK